MRKNSKRNNAKRERVIMIASSVFVLSALTLTGIYMRTVERESQDDGYKIDFTALEDNADDKFQEIAKNDQDDYGINDIGNFLGNEMNTIADSGELQDFMPVEEAGSGLVEIPGLTDGTRIQEEIPSQGGIVLPKETIMPSTPAPKPSDGEKQQEAALMQEQQEKEQREKEQREKEQKEKDEQEKAKATEGTVVARNFHFVESEGLQRPVSGAILMPYSMDRSIYFSTMRDYRYNPALVLEAEAGTDISACAAGKVINIFSNEEIGHAITVDMGNGYQITYGQLEGINVTLNSYVNKGDRIASVAAPTKYYCVEGSNLYLEMTKDGEPVDPEPLFR